MRIESRRLFGRFAFIRNVALVFLLIIGADQIFGISIRPLQPPPPPPPTGYLTVTIDAPPNINSAVQWYVSQNGGGSSGWLNNGDTAAMPSGSYTISFRPITGWAVPANQGVSLPAGSTNTFSGSYSFISLSGDYQGLFSEASGPKYESCGFCEISSGKGLSFTAKISTQGKKYSLSGKFDAGGNAWGTISPSDASPLSVHFVSGEDILTGEISNETWTATILAKRNIFAAKSHPASQAGKYTFVLESETNSTGQPGGDSFGTMTIDKSGGVTLAATFSDGAKASQKTILTKDGLWPFYVSLYSGKGFACGWLQLQGDSELNPPKAELDRQCDYSGGGVFLTPGDYSFWTLYYDGLYYTGSYDLDLGAGRSLKVPTGWSVSLYTNDGCAGTPFTKTTDDSCFADLGLLIQSIRVETNGIKTIPDFGNVIWAKPSQTKAAAYSTGFTNQIQAFVSPYHSTTNGSQLNFSAGAIVLQNPDSSQSVTNEFSMDSASKATGANKLNLTVVNSSGAFKGSLKNPLTGKQTSFSGVVLQKQNFGRGFFFDGDQSGLVCFGP